MAQENPIKFLKGAGKQVKAQFQLGNVSVPASAFARMIPVSPASSAAGATWP